MKTQGNHWVPAMSRTLKGVIASLSLISATAALAAPIGQVGVFVSGETLAKGKEIHVDSGSRRIAASKEYKYKFSGNCRGLAGTPMAKLVPAGTPIGTFLDSLKAGSSSLLSGTVQNPSGNLPFTVIDLPVSGSKTITGVPGLTKIHMSMRIVGTIEADGLCRLDVTEVKLRATPRQKLGSIKFMKGSKLLISAIPTVLFKKSNTVVSETAGSVSVPVWRDTNYHGAVSVDYTTVNGTATAGTDYVAKSGTINFADGETKKNISVQLIDNEANDGVRRFKIQLSNPNKALLVPRTSTQVTISDDE